MNRARNGRKTGRSMPIIICLVLVIGVGLFGIYYWEMRQQKQAAQQYTDEPFVPAQTVTMDFDGKPYKLRENLDTYLLIGLDKFSDTLSDPSYFLNNQQADFLFLIVVDHNSKSYSAIHLNRDTMTEIQRLGMGGVLINTYIGQLALSHTYGSGGKDSCRNTVQAVSRFLLDVPVEHYLSLTMDAIPVLNDLVGGVVVHIDDDFSAIDPALVQGKDIRLRGKQALTFVRSRKDVGDETNLSRMNRQRAYLFGLREQIMLKLNSDSAFGRRLIAKLAEFNVTDLTSDEILQLAERVKDYSFTGIRSVEGEAVKGEKFIEFYANEDSLRELVKESFFKAA